MKTMVCMGDSLTEGADLPAGHAWPELVAKTLNLTVINAGIGGDTTQGMLARFYPQVVAHRSTFVFILGGTNDLWWGWEINTILGNLFSMVVQALHNGITPLIGLPLPVDITAARASNFSGPWGGYDRLVKKLDHLIEALTRQAAESEVAVVDLHRPLLTNDRRIDSDLFMADGLHPNEAGHRRMAEAIGAAVQQQVTRMMG